MYKRPTTFIYRTSWPMLAALGLLAAAGCDDGRPYRVPVSGQVLIDGKPLHCGYIRFVPENARPSGAQISLSGRFRLSCFAENDGAVLGKHRIAVQGCEALSEEEMIWHAPKKYASCETSGLTATIEGPTDSLVIHLTWDGDSPYLETFDGDN